MYNIDEILRNIPAEHEKNIEHIINDYMRDSKCKETLKLLDYKDIVCVGNVMRVVSSVPPSFLECEMCSNEYENVYKYLQKSVETNNIAKELGRIYDEKIQKTLRVLRFKQLKIFPMILGNQFENYKRIRKNKKEKARELFDIQFAKTPEGLREKYDGLNPERNKSRFLNLDIDLLNIKINDDDFLKYVAFLILFPEHQIINFTMYFDGWDEFPLKWYFQNRPINLSKDIFLHYRKDKNILNDFFVQIYASKNFKKLSSFLDSPYLKPPMMHILCERRSLIEEIINCYKQNYFSSVVCTALPIIEGILWDFSIYVHQKEGNVYPDLDNTQITLDCLRKEYTIGEILKKTKFRERLDIYFIDYFCNELYNERNPILHGNNTIEYFTTSNAAKKIATIEYLLEIIDNYSRNIIQQHLRKTIPPETQSDIKI